MGVLERFREERALCQFLFCQVWIEEHRDVADEDAAQQCDADFVVGQFHQAVFHERR